MSQAHSPMATLRRFARLAVAATLFTLVVVGLVPAPRASASTPTIVAVVASQQGNGLRVNGLLTDNRGQGIKNQPVVIGVVGVMTVPATTDGGGRFNVNLGLPAIAGVATLTITASYQGDHQHSPASASTRLQYLQQGNAATSAPPPSQPANSSATPLPATPAASTPATPTPVGNMLVQLAAQKGQLEPGATFQVNGVITSDGVAVQDATLQLAVRGSAPQPMTAMSNAKGQFTLMGQVPEDAKAGPLTIDVAFGGAEGMAPTQASVVITVAVKKTPTPTASPAPTQEVAAASAAPAPAAAAPSPSVTASATTVVEPAVSQNTLSPATLRTFSLVGLGLVATIGVFAGVAFFSRKPVAEELSSFDSLID